MKTLTLALREASFWGWGGGRRKKEEDSKTQMKDTENYRE